MAIQIDYFLATDEEAAAATAELPTGPRGETSDVVTSADVDPGLGLGYLNELLTGTPLESFLQTEGPSLVAASADDQKLVLELDASLVRRLGELTAPFDELAQEWAGVEAPEEADAWEPRTRDLVEFLTSFTALARRSFAGEGSVYCWLWP